jgi:hypothetical protein
MGFIGNFNHRDTKGTEFSLDFLSVLCISVVNFCLDLESANIVNWDMWAGMRYNEK